MIRAFCLAVATTALTACTISVATVQESAKGTDITYDRFLHRYTVTGVQLELGELINVTRYQLRGGFDDHGDNEFFQLYLDHWDQSGWRFLDTTVDSDGQPLETRVLSRDVQSSSAVEEIVAADLSRQYLEAHATSGLEVKIFGKSGDIELKFQPIYIQGFLQAFDQARAHPGALPPAGSPANPPPSLAVAAPPPPPPVPAPVAAPLFSEGASFQTDRSPEQMTAVATQVLTGQGYQIQDSGTGAGPLTTQPLGKRLTTKDANCGSMMGIPYLLDDRAQTTVIVEVLQSQQAVTVKVAVAGTYKPGHGAADKVLNCTSRGTIENELVAGIRVAAGSH